MLTCMMYHHINSDKYSNSLSMFSDHLTTILENYVPVLPGDTLAKNSLCLTFDDAYFDFYYYVFPLLKKYDVKALLAVPSDFILDDTPALDKERLLFSHDQCFANKISFCTYKELKEMSDSGLVKIASHSCSHANLTGIVDLNYEIAKSKSRLSKQLDITVDSFVLPYGKYNAQVLAECHKHYRYVFRIGNGFNQNFNGVNGLIYRIDADGLTSPGSVFSYWNTIRYKLKSIIKSVQV